MQADLDSHEMMAHRSEEESGQLEEERAAFMKSVDITEKAIISRGKELKEFVDQCTWSLLQELTSIQSDGLKAIDCKTDENDKFKTNRTDFRSIDGAGDGYNQMQQLSNTSVQQTIPSIRISFEMSKLEEFTKRDNIVGKIKREDKRAVAATANAEFGFHQDATMLRKKETKANNPKKNRPGINKPGLEEISNLPLLCATYAYRPIDQQNPRLPIANSHSISLIKTLDLPRVWGVTKLDGNIYVLLWMPNSIRVFDDTYPYRLRDEIQIEEIRNPEDIASSDKTKCLYVTDLHGKCIWEITQDDQVNRWLSNVDWPFTLSVSSDGHLLLLRDTLNQQTSTLEIYGTNAILINSISLPCEIQHPLHAIQKPDGQFIVVHRLTNRETGQWVISQLTTEGQLISMLIPKAELIGNLDWPFHLALDSENDRLFVADYWNHRVIKCDSFNCGQTILKNTIHRPLRLCYDGKTKQLLVANAGRLDIYIER